MSDTYDSMPLAASNAFAVFANIAQRSLNKTADILGIPRGTVASWSHRYRWRERLRDEDTDATRGTVEAGIILAAAQHLENIQEAVNIRRTASSPVARMKAIEYLDSIIAPVRERMASGPSSDSALSAAINVSELVALAASGDVTTLVAIAQGRTPPALPVVVDADAE